MNRESARRTPAPDPTARTHVVVELGRDTAVFGVDVGLGEEGRHLGKSVRTGWKRRELWGRLERCDAATFSMDCLMSWPSLSDIRPMLSETLFMPSARLSGRAFTALDMFLMELLRGFTNVSI